MATKQSGKAGPPRRPGKPTAKSPEPAQTTAAAPPRGLPPLAAAAIVFMAAGAVLILEILAVRLLAPYVGLTLETTTSIIGATLAGIAGGAAIGGMLADRTDTRLLVVRLLIGGGMLALLTVPLVHWLGPGVRGKGDLAALGVTLVALVPAAAVLSAASPAVAHLQLRDLTRSGTVVGRLSAWGTAGALIGTFGTGFVLIPLLPASTAILLTGAVLIISGLVLAVSTHRVSKVAMVGAAVIGIGLGTLSATSSSPCQTETTYHCASVAVAADDPDGRTLLLDNVSHSYVDVKDPTHLKFPYVQWIADGINGANPGKKPLNVVFVGGGGFTLPRWLLATRPGSQAHVLEVDGELVDFDKEKLGLRTSPDLRVTVGDARMSLRDVPTDSADVVVGDAFGSYVIPWHLATKEWTQDIKRVMKPGGLYALNIIDFPPLEALRAEIATLRDVFPYVRMVGYSDYEGKPLGANAVLLASDRPMSAAVDSERADGVTFSEDEVAAIAGGASVLTDDNAPVDQLLTIKD